MLYSFSPGRGCMMQSLLLYFRGNTTAYLVVVRAGLHTAVLIIFMVERVIVQDVLCDSRVGIVVARGGIN